MPWYTCEDAERGVHPGLHEEIESCDEEERGVKYLFTQRLSDYQQMALTGELNNTDTVAIVLGAQQCGSAISWAVR